MNRLNQSIEEDYRRIRNDVVDTYHRYRGEVYENIKNLSRRLGRYESCDWQCVQGCYNNNLTYDLAEDCF